jgi:hypothetical protein
MALLTCAGRAPATVIRGPDERRWRDPVSRKIGGERNPSLVVVTGVVNFRSASASRVSLSNANIAEVSNPLDAAARPVRGVELIELGRVAETGNFADVMTVGRFALTVVGDAMTGVFSTSDSTLLRRSLLNALVMPVNTTLVGPNNGEIFN